MVLPSVRNNSRSRRSKTILRHVSLLVVLVVVTVTVRLLWIGFSSTSSSHDYDTVSTDLVEMLSQFGSSSSSSFGQPQTIKKAGGGKVVADGSDGGPIKVAHAISLVSCHKASTVRGFMDALIILRHSIHQNSIHNNNNNNGRTSSKYSYQMYAIIHEDGCKDPGLPPLLRRLGYIPLVVPTPVNLNDIKDDWYRTHVEGENCCGIKEFIKLYAYTLTDHPIVVHWDLDVAVLQPMDDLYDAILYDKDSPQGQAARQRLLIQRPSVQTPLPDRIDAFFTRDITSGVPWRKAQVVQGGFAVARPSLEHFELYKKFILEGNYKKGRGEGSGWDGLGYGGIQGAMAYQGALAYFYDVIYPGHHVELDVCRWNQVVADVIWRGPNKLEHKDQCRDYPSDGNFTNNTPENGQCEDCRVLPIEETMTVHYTACKKPWECLIPHPRKPRDPRQQYRLKELTNITTCGLLFRKYFEFRRDIEHQIAEKSGVPVPTVPLEGTFHPEYFLGYCKGGHTYRTMEELPKGFDLKQVYGF